MSIQKRQIRSDFRKAVFHRDRYRCRACGNRTIPDLLDAHHIMPREDMFNGGYVKENGITICKLPSDGSNPQDQRSCHEKAEEWLKTGSGEEGYDPETLYQLIGSSLDLALRVSEKRK